MAQVTGFSWPHRTVGTAVWWTEPRQTLGKAPLGSSLHAMFHQLVILAE